MRASAGIGFLFPCTIDMHSHGHKSAPGEPLDIKDVLKITPSFAHIDNIGHDILMRA